MFRCRGLLPGGKGKEGTDKVAAARCASNDCCSEPGTGREIPGEHHQIPSPSTHHVYHWGSAHQLDTCSTWWYCTECGRRGKASICFQLASCLEQYGFLEPPISLWAAASDTFIMWASPWVGTCSGAVPLAPTGTHAEEAQLSFHCNIWQRISCSKNIKINTSGTKQIWKKHAGALPYSSVREGFGSNTEETPKSKTSNAREGR